MSPALRARALVAVLGAVSLVAGAAGPGNAAAGVGPGDPFQPHQWGLAAVNATGAWQHVSGHPDAVVAVVDSGVDWTHLDLRANLWDGNPMHGASFARPLGLFAELPAGAHSTTLDENGHGTLVAGVVGAVAENGLGVRGMAQTPLMVVKVFGLGAPGHAEAVADGIRWASANGARVITLSLAAFDHPALRAAVREAWCAGAVLVAASGNHGQAEPRYPAGYPEVVAVGAVDEELALWPATNRGVDLYAPGVDVLTTGQGNLYGTATGTSLAAPFVAGAAALVIAANPALTNVDVVGILRAGAAPLAGADAPLLDAGGAVALAQHALPGGVAPCA